MKSGKTFKNEPVMQMVATALVMALICVATMIIKIPIPMTEGYVHLGDAMIFLGVLILGKNRGALAAGIGSALGDLFAGYAAWIPWTLGIKFIMAFIMGFAIEKAAGKFPLVEVLAMILAGIEMVAGYYVAASLMTGNWVVPLASIPWNIGQFVMGIVLAVIFAAVLEKTPVGEQMTYKFQWSFKGKKTDYRMDQ